MERTRQAHYPVVTERLRNCVVPLVSATGLRCFWRFPLRCAPPGEDALMQVASEHQEHRPQTENTRSINSSASFEPKSNQYDSLRGFCFGNCGLQKTVALHSQTLGTDITPPFCSISPSHSFPSATLHTTMCLRHSRGKRKHVVSHAKRRPQICFWILSAVYGRHYPETSLYLYPVVSTSGTRAVLAITLTRTGREIQAV